MVASRCPVASAGVSRVVALLAMLCAFAPAQADDSHIAPVLNFIRTNVRSWLSDPIIIETLKAQNAANMRLTRPEIEALDTEWRNEVNRPSHPLIDRVLATPLSGFLREKEEEAFGSITEVFVIDAKGLNAGQSAITSDYWQGDEEKFTESFEKGPEAVFVGVARKDESTQTLQSQVSITIVDEHNKPIGAIVVGVNLEQL